MISYNLAKKLKEAGYPFERRFDGTKFTKEGDMIRGWISMKGKKYQELHKIPTLSELIEECGKEFSQVGRNFDEGVRVDEQWMALSRRKLGKIGAGKTPEEAVAKLWLKLKS